MKFPPKPETPYILDTPQNKRMFRKLNKLAKKKLTKKDKELLRLLYSQLEKNWEGPLEKFIDTLLQ